MATRPASTPLNTTHWTMPGADGAIVRVSTDASVDNADGAIIFAHGFKGYKDYGFIPVLSARLVKALPIAVHRFNFSHSGVADDPSVFERPDLFEKNTWNKQVIDLDAMLDHCAAGEAPNTPAQKPLVLIGHSRGGTTCLLCAGRRRRDQREPNPTGILTIAAADRACNLDQATIRLLRSQGSIISPSARTGQTLRVGAAWLHEQEESPEDHEVLGLCGHISCRVLAVHGAEDPTVSVECAERIAGACPRGESFVITGANHVLNTPNPADPSAPLSPQLESLVSRAIEFVRDVALDSI